MLNKSSAGRIFQVNIESDHNTPMQYKNVLLYQLGEVRYEQGVIDKHQQWCYEISIILSGTGIFSMDGVDIPVKSDDIILSPKQGTHTITASDNKFRFLYLGFDLAEDACFEYLTVFQMYLKALRCNQCAEDHYGIGTILNSMITEFNQELPYSFEYLTNCLETVMILAYRTFGSFRLSPALRGVAPASVGTTVYTLIKYVEDHIFSIPDIRTLAREMHFNYTYISHAFRKKTGITLQKYILQVKIKKSQELIAENRWSLSEIACMLNYESIQSFSKAFRKETGMSPREYRKRHMEQQDSIQHESCTESMGLGPDSG